jgi:hypothetical protein
MDGNQIRVGGSTVGIIGLKSALEDMAEEYAERPSGELMEELLNLLCQRNYIFLKGGYNGNQSIRAWMP